MLRELHKDAGGEGQGWGSSGKGVRSLAKDRLWKVVTPFVTMTDSIPP